MKQQNAAKRLDPEVWDKIDKWRLKGWSYEKLSKKFKVSKSTLSYRYGEGQKEKTLNRRRKRRTKFQSKIDSFFDRAVDQKRSQHLWYKRPERTYESKVRSFFKDKNYSTKGVDMKTRIQQMTEHLWPYEGKDKNGLSHPYVSCSITGRKVSVMAPKGHPLAANIDHEIPAARGGTNEISNAQILAEKINEIKGDMTNEELFEQIYGIIINEPFIKFMEKSKKCQILIKHK
tara:strand:+ start:78 stop:770 length:693 start_codon:yes stop_codon:yes gene_type:complete